MEASTTVGFGVQSSAQRILEKVTMWLNDFFLNLTRSCVAAPLIGAGNILLISAALEARGESDALSVAVWCQGGVVLSSHYSAAVASFVHRIRILLGTFLED